MRGKHKGNTSAYTEDRNLALLRAFRAAKRHLLQTYGFIDLSQAIELARLSSCPRYYVSESRASQVLRQLIAYDAYLHSLRPLPPSPPRFSAHTPAPATVPAPVPAAFPAGSVPVPAAPAPPVPCSCAAGSLPATVPTASPAVLAPVPAAFAAGSAPIPNPLHSMIYERQRLFTHLYAAYRTLRTEHPDWSHDEIVVVACASPAPEFFLTPASTREILSKITRSKKQNK